MNFNLKWFGPKIVEEIQEAIKPATEEVAKDIASDAKALVPVKTGFLRDHIEVSESKYAGHIVMVTDVPYAARVEYGYIKQSARPFMRPALEKNRSRGEKKIKEAIERYLAG